MPTILILHITLFFLQIYSMTLRLSALFEAHVRDIISDWKLTHRSSGHIKESRYLNIHKYSDKFSNEREVMNIKVHIYFDGLVLDKRNNYKIYIRAF